MDLARIELSRICSANNPHSWSLKEEQSWEDHRYYFLDKIGDNETGETSLHRVMAQHAPPESIQHYLRHLANHHATLPLRTPSCYDHLGPPPSILAQNRLGCTALHVVVHRNSWQVHEVVDLLLDHCPSLASIPMCSGSYPLHIATGHGATIHPSVIQALVDADPSVLEREDYHSDTPLSLLWKNVLRFRWARDWEVDGLVPDFMSEDKEDLSWMTVITPNQFRDLALMLLPHRPLTWHSLASTRRCPPLLVRLLLEPSQRDYIEGDLCQVDELGRLPLHCAAGAEEVTRPLVPDEVRQDAPSVLRVLLAATPEAAGHADHSGSLPLHHALRRESLPSDEDLMDLIITFPDALTIPDPITRLYPAQQLASRLSDDGLDLLYWMLRFEPDVLNYHRL